MISCKDLCNCLFCISKSFEIHYIESLGSASNANNNNKNWEISSNKLMLYGVLWPVQEKGLSRWKLWVGCCWFLHTTRRPWRWGFFLLITKIQFIFWHKYWEESEIHSSVCLRLKHLSTYSLGTCRNFTFSDASNSSSSSSLESISGRITPMLNVATVIGLIETKSGCWKRPAKCPTVVKILNYTKAPIHCQKQNTQENICVAKYRYQKFQILKSQFNILFCVSAPSGWNLLSLQWVEYIEMIHYTLVFIKE